MTYEFPPEAMRRAHTPQNPDDPDTHLKALRQRALREVLRAALGSFFGHRRELHRPLLDQFELGVPLESFPGDTEAQIALEYCHLALTVLGPDVNENFVRAVEAGVTTGSKKWPIAEIGPGPTYAALKAAFTEAQAAVFLRTMKDAG